MKRYGCKSGLPHDYKPIHETVNYKWEVCHFCGKKVKWNKRAKGRVDNKKYLEAHVRNFAQRWGRTKRVYHQIYKPEKLKIVI